jgi:C1A family cysteine protease
MEKRIYNLSLKPHPSAIVPPRHPLCFYRGPLHLKPQLPAKVDFSAKFPACYEQEALGSCTANALCAAVTYKVPTLLGSRLFLYYNERKMEGTINTDSGAYIYDGVIALKTYGICHESEWPYIIANFTVALPLSAIPVH